MSEQKPSIAMADPYFDEADRQAIHLGIDKILTQALSMGPNVHAFEREFAALCGVRHAVAMNSCTSALEAALMGLGVKPGDEVIVPCETFIATGMAVHLVGGTPVFAEIEPSTFCLSLEDVKKRVTPATRGVIMVYMGGLIPENILEFRDFCDSRGIFLLEDAAHAPGANRGGKTTGSFGHAGCFSFFPTKVMTSGEGGMLTTDDDDLAQYARSWQHRGRDMSAPVESYCRPGRNVRMTEAAALLGRIQLARLHELLAGRRRVMRIYREGFKVCQSARLVTPEEDQASSCWKIPLVLEKGCDRPALIKTLQEAGITVDTAYQPALHLQPVFRSLYGTQPGMLPASEELLSRHICLPCHPRISDADARYVVETLLSILKGAGGER